MAIDWESELAQLLGRLSAAQEQLLALLAHKRDVLLQRDHAGLADLLPQEQALCSELQACHDRRQELLDQANEAGLPADSIQALAAALPSDDSEGLQQPLAESIERSQLLRHQSVAQWVAVQRTMLHLSHILEIIATGSHTKPTYGKGSAHDTGGALMDQAV